MSHGSGYWTANGTKHSKTCWHRLLDVGTYRHVWVEKNSYVSYGSGRRHQVSTDSERSLGQLVKSTTSSWPEDLSSLHLVGGDLNASSQWHDQCTLRWVIAAPGMLMDDRNVDLWVISIQMRAVRGTRWSATGRQSTKEKYGTKDGTLGYSTNHGAGWWIGRSDSNVL